MGTFQYSGAELGVFEHAKNWKEYWAGQITPFFGKSILEVGAGIGANTKNLCSIRYDKWVCLEPDSSFCELICEKIKSGNLPNSIELRSITSADLTPGELFDTVLYIDVLEHIEHDRLELENVLKHLTDDGKIIIVAPAHNFLYSEFDRKIGHFRRYNKKMLYDIVPRGMRIARIRYLDSVGLLASLANRLVIKAADPSHRQIQFWDQFMVRPSRLLDPLCGYSLGKSILCILEKT